MDQVLRNLLKNAILHTPDGGSIVLDGAQATEDERRRQSITALCPSSFVTLRVIDRGSGIAPEDLANVFDRLYRAVPGDRQAAVEAHGRRAWAANAPGQGACISFTLPPAPAELHHALTSN